MMRRSSVPNGPCFPELTTPGVFVNEEAGEEAEEDEDDDENDSSGPWWKEGGHTNSSCATAQPTTTCNTLSSCPPRRTNAEQGQELGDHAGPSAPLPRSSANAAAGGKPECSPDARCCVAGRQT
ncbi:uncharacterized protein LOC116666016 isoform X4 [Camelus ferus]|uniref:Uncharacterized protein LOC116666016 isoform X4 n=1 Tax=Camelus ferus TaxID=419612 RepID=A0A8B8TNK0_CAMFR|nr:uncharacterized protein LOC116666016 isoform X4 [Camelus ferus]